MGSYSINIPSNDTFNNLTDNQVKRHIRNAVAYLHNVPISYITIISFGRYRYRRRLKVDLNCDLGIKVYENEQTEDEFNQTLNERSNPGGINVEKSDSKIIHVSLKNFLLAQDLVSQLQI